MWGRSSQYSEEQGRLVDVYRANAADRGIIPVKWMPTLQGTVVAERTLTQPLLTATSRLGALNLERSDVVHHQCAQSLDAGWLLHGSPLRVPCSSSTPGGPCLTAVPVRVSGPNRAP